MRKYQADIYILNVLNFCGKAKIYEIQKLFHIATCTIPTKPVQNLLDVTVDAGSVPVVY